MSKKHKKVCRVLNYTDHSLIVISTITGCISISAFASLVDIPIGITSSANKEEKSQQQKKKKKERKRNLIK